MRRVGIFGGTFNPPHKGHLHLATTFVNTMGLDEVLILPAAVPPHKAAPDLAPAEERLKLCQDTFSSLPAEVSRLEIDREGKSYTIDTLTFLTEKYAKLDREEGNEEGTTLYFLMGDDMLLYFPNWYRAKDILSLCTLVSSVRSKDISVEALESFAKATYPEEYRQGKFLFLKMEPFPVSSSFLREKVKQGEDIRDWVTPKVAEEIKRKGLYRS